MKPALLLSALAASALAASIPTVASAASTVVLPASMCPNSDPIFANGFEATPAVPSQPSLGSGGAYPGNVTRSVNVPGLGTRTYYLHLPTAYTPTRAWPLLIALHGAGGAGTAPGAAQQVRGDWSAAADASGFIVLAPIASGSSGGWIISEPPGTGDDDAIRSAAIADTEQSYNVEGSRRYIWGFSAGGHVAHAVALNVTSIYAAYSVSAGVLRAATCSVPNDPMAPACANFLASVTPKIPVDIHIGTGDSLYAETQNDLARLIAGGWATNRTLYFVPFAGGHTYTVAQLGEIWNHLCPFALAQ